MLSGADMNSKNANLKELKTLVVVGMAWSATTVWSN
ncbi:hypothetical protein PFWH6_3152 [Pseudomonas fluorescens WH6]|nr:hypothetical protein PFWH6_3152 [Pseudomonas fluorescens WH6]